MTSWIIHKGGCHCGRILFEVQAPEQLEATLCNCSICSKTGFLHLIVPASRFRLIRGEEELSTYTFGTHTAKHYFCKICGVKSFYVPRSNPDGYSVNVRCLDPSTIKAIKIATFDGQHWELHAHELAYLSQDVEGIGEFHEREKDSDDCG